MLTRFVCLFVIFLSHIACGSRSRLDGYDLNVAGGQEVVLDAPLARSSVAVYQWFSKWDKQLTYTCGATLVSPTRVVSAAHCFRASAEAFYVVLNPHPSRDTLRVADLDKHDHIVLIAKDGISIHPEYDRDNDETPDLAVIRLDRPLLSPYQPASLVPNDLPLPEKASLTLASFGPTIRDGEDDGVLRSLVMPFAGLDSSDPSGRKLLAQGVPGTPGLTGCPGDSGGSIYFEHKGEMKVLGVLIGGRHGCLTETVGDNINVIQDLRKEWQWLQNEIPDL